MADLKSLRAAIHANRAEFTRVVQAHQADANLSAIGRQKLIKDAHAEATARHQALVAERQTAIRETRNALVAKAFDPAHENFGAVTAADKYAMRALYGQAAARALDSDPKKLAKLLDLAIVSGDAVTAKAIAAAAYSEGHSEVVAHYAEAYPVGGGYLRELADFEKEAGIGQGPDAKLAERIDLTGPSIPYAPTIPAAGEIPGGGMNAAIRGGAASE